MRPLLLLILTSVSWVSIAQCPNPNYNLWNYGNNTVCPPNTLATLYTSGSEADVSYQLRVNGNNWGEPLPGNYGQLYWYDVDQAGTYTVIATNNTSGCSVILSGSVNISSNAPAIYSLTGTNLCTTLPSSTITLSGSQSGVNYQLQRDGNNYSSKWGSGGTLTWTGINQAGTYTIEASDGGCYSTMNGSVTRGTPPNQYYVSGGGTICSGNENVTVNLNDSQSGVTYQLKKNGSNVGAPQPGTGGSISWNNLSGSGTYTVVASNGGCSTSMNGSASITDNRPTAYNVTGGGCTGDGTITLSGSQTNANYTLLVNGSYAGSLQGTGNALIWTNQLFSGTYTITATSNYGCPNVMNGSAIIDSPPITYNVSGGGYTCTEGQKFSVNLNYSQTGINYQLQRDGANVGSLIAGAQGPLTWSNLSTSGTYTVTAINPTSGCSMPMSGDAKIYGMPSLFTVSGGGSFCAGGSGLNVTLSGSQNGVEYRLYRNGSYVGGTLLNGTGGSLTWSQVVGGTYTVMAEVSNSGCPLQMTGSATITVNSLPAQFSVGGGGTYCGSGSVTLNGSQSGINYQLKLNGVNNGSAVAGTGSSLTWSNVTSSGTYTIVATNPSTACVQTMSGSAVITVNPLPTLYTVGGGGSYCTGGTSPNVTLSGSQSGVNYHLKVNGVNSGSSKPGTGSSLTWTNQSTGGTYTVVATNSSTNCSQTMSGSATVTVNGLPNLYTVGGGGTICASGGSATITLSGSQTGVNYQLKANGTNSGSAVAGTNGALSWTNQTTAGTYTIVATIVTTGCTRTMTGSATVTVVSVPTAYNVGGGGSYCSGSNGVNVTLSGSQSGINYQLKINGVNSGSAKAGTGSALTWASQTATGTYTVVGSSATLSTCTQNMTGSAAVSVNPLPTQYTVGGGGAYCSGGSGLTITLSSSQTGINYQLLLNGANSGSAIAGSGSSLSWPNKTASGTYTVVGTNATTNCSQSMTGSANITVNSLPTLYTVYGGGNYCTGGTGVSVFVSDSDSGVNYQLKINGSNSGSVVAGTGGQLTWSSQTTSGTYTIVATNASTSCTSTMTGSATVTANPLPAQYTTSGGGSFCPEDSGVPVNLSNSQTGVVYKLKWNGADTGLTQPGTDGISLTWANQKKEGTYTVVASYAATGCSNAMLSSAAVTIKPAPAQFTASGGGIIPSGSTGTEIQVSDSETGDNYQLKVNGSNSGAAVAGTGEPLEWTGLTTEGTYTITATKTSSGCATLMTGAPQVLIAIASSSAILNNYAFRYKYDERRRMTHKKVPGAEEVYMVYDNRDRLVMTQDGEQRVSNQWSFTKYDALNQPIITGVYTHTGPLDQDGMDGLISTTNFYETYNGDPAMHGYTDTVFPAADFPGTFETLSATYYDNYDFKALLANTEFDYKPGLIGCQTRTNGEYCQPAFSDRVVGQITGMRTKVLEQPKWLSTVNYYDDKYRLIQSTSVNYRDGIERTTQVVDFVGKVLASKSTNVEGATSHSILRTFEYDHAGRLLKTWHSLDGATPVLLASNEYNELGQLVTKKLHSEDNGTTFKQHVDYRYNIRGWLMRINNSDLTPDDSNDPRDHFGMNLIYNDVISGIDNTPQYNGNISATKYSTNQGFDPGLTERAYKYSYDPMNRLTAATHFEKSGSWSTSAALHEDNIAYDLNTNILSIRRKGGDGSQMDNLVFDYGTGTTRNNQLLKVTDAWDKTKGFVDGANTGNDYSYDANGNRLTDQNKGITTAITYNYMNLAEKIVMPGGNYLLNVYDAAGTKLSQGVYNSSNVLQKKTDYVGEFLYENDTLKYISNEEGRYNMLTSAYEYELRDHLSNNRVTFTTKEEQDAATATVETANLTEEQAKFLRYENARRISSHLFDKTNGSAPSTTPGYAVRLNGSANERMGLARSFAVVPGDTVKAEVYVKYIDTNSGNWTSALNTLLTQIANGTAPAGTVIDGASYSTSTSSFPYAGLLNTSGSTGTGPKAYLNWLIFDQNFMFINGGYVRMTDAAREYGQDCAHEKLTAEFAITEPGYVYAYLSNENEAVVDVFFDQFTVSLVKSPVINATDLYPYGAPAISYTRENSLKQDRLMNGNEWIDELGYNNHDLGQRNIDPFIPVFPAIDRFAEKLYSMSPYQYAVGNPVNFVDANGDSIVSIVRQDNQIIITNSPLKERGDNFTNTITLSNTVNQDQLSDYSAGIVNDAMVSVGDNEVTVTSGSRTAEDQARIMYSVMEGKDGVEYSYELYGSSGDQVVDVYVNKQTKTDKQGYTFNEHTPEEIKSAMTVKIDKLGNVSNHISNNPKTFNVFDIGPSSVSNPKSFANTLDNDSRVAKVLSPYSKPRDKAIHVEITQPK